MTDAIKQAVGPLPINRRDYTTFANVYERAAAEAADEGRAKGAAKLMAESQAEEATIAGDEDAAWYWESVE